MDTLHRLTNATRTPWTWIFLCWALRKEVLSAISECRTRNATLEKEYAQCAEKARILKVDLDRVRAEHEALKAQHETAKDGCRALITFISRRHRLGTVPAPNSLREILETSK